MSKKIAKKIIASANGYTIETHELAKNYLSLLNLLRDNFIADETANAEDKKFLQDEINYRLKSEL